VVSILHGVEAVEERWLGGGAGGGVGCTSGAATKSGSASSTGGASGRGSRGSGGGSKTSAGLATTNHGARLALETVVTLLAAGQNSALLLKVGHADSWEGRGAVVLGSVVVDLVDWDGGVDDMGLDGLLVDHRLDLLVDVVVNVLAGDRWGNGRGVLDITLLGGVLELSSLSCEALLNLCVTAVLELAVLNCTKVVVVLLGESLFVVNWLN